MSVPRSAPQQWAEHAAALLYSRGARRVWAWGSLGEGRRLDMHSDVDLAVEGISAVQVETIKSELARRAPCKIDIVVMEETDAQVRWFVARGRELPRGVPGVLANDHRTTLRDKRRRAVVEALRESGARRVVDLGCGTGWLVRELARHPEIRHVLGIDKDDDALRAARGRLAPAERERVTLSHALFTWCDPGLRGHDAAAAVEVMEHLEPPQLAAFERVVFGFARPATVVVTTPNAEYNGLFGLRAGERRHPDHRFELTRAEFSHWGARIASEYGYAFTVTPIGSEHPERGSATQLGTFASTAAC
jgi:SAM-dependent methyltransferase